MTADRRVRVGSSTEFREGVITACNIGGTEVILIRLRGSLVCYLDRCAHQPIKLSEFGELNGSVLVCHAHGGGFDVAKGGRVLCGPPKDALTSFKCIEDNGEVFVIIDKK